MAFTRSDASSNPASASGTASLKSSKHQLTHHQNHHHSRPSPSLSSSSSFISSPPHTPRRSSHLALPPDVGLLTPASSKASLSPAAHHLKGGSVPASPALSHNSGRRLRRGPSHRRPLYPTRPSLSLELTVQPALFAPHMTASSSSRSVSPRPHARPLSPAPPIDPIPRPPSRCESLLRDTLRRAEDYERTQHRRSTSRSPVRWAGERRSRPRGNSLLGALSGAGDVADGDGDDDGDVYSSSILFRPHATTAPRFVRGAISSSPPEAVHYPYGSPSSPSPMPPSMLRTRTAPAVPRVAKASAHDSENGSRGLQPRPPQSPRGARHSLPNTVIGGGSLAGPQSHPQSNTATSNESSPKQRHHALSPHESVLRAKLEHVLQRAGPTPLDEKLEYHPQFSGRVRNHQRSQSHGVTVVSPQKPRDGAASAAVSPRPLGLSSLTNSVSDLGRLDSCTPSHRRNSNGHKAGSASPSSPSEPLTPPPTPPFNARTASEVCKRMDGYVSFANVEGLGEPPGMDIDGEDGEDGARRWARWWRMWPFTNGANGAEHHEAGHLVPGRERSESASSR